MMRRDYDWEGIAIALIVGLVAGYFAYGIVNPNVCAFSSSAFCVNGMVEEIVSPGAEEKLINAIESAEESIHIILFQFSYPELKEALVLAEERGVEVKIILDPAVDSNLDTAEFLKSKGVEVRWSSPKFTYSHAKTAIIDGRRVITGSLNWSRNAMLKNREIGVLIENEELARELEKVFEGDWREGLEVK